MSYLNCGKQYVFGGLIQQNPLEEMEGSPKKGKLRLSRGNLRIGGVGPPHQPSPVQDPLGGGGTPPKIGKSRAISQKKIPSLRTETHNRASGLAWSCQSEFVHPIFHVWSSPLGLCGTGHPLKIWVGSGFVNWKNTLFNWEKLNDK